MKIDEEKTLSVRKFLSRATGEDSDSVTATGKGGQSIQADMVQIERVCMDLAINVRMPCLMEKP